MVAGVQVRAADPAAQDLDQELPRARASASGDRPPTVEPGSRRPPSRRHPNLVGVTTFRLAGIDVPRIGLGTNRLTTGHVAFVRDAVAAGVRHIDTAHLYTGGESERAIGEALDGSSEDVLVATKGGYRAGEGRPEVLGAQIEQSLQSLRTEAIGLYYLHRVDPRDAAGGEPGRDQGLRRPRRDPPCRRLRGERRADRARAPGRADRRRAEPLQPRGPRARRRHRLLHARGDRVRALLPAARRRRAGQHREARAGCSGARPSSCRSPARSRSSTCARTSRRSSSTPERRGPPSGAHRVRRAGPPAPGRRRARRARPQRGPLRQRRRRLERGDLERPGRRQRRRRHRRAARPLRRLRCLGVEALLLRPAAGPARPALAAGFTREPAETLLVAEIADLALDVPPPAGVELRAVVDQRGVDAVVAVHDEVFGEDHSALGAVLARGLTERPRRVEALIAVAGETPIAAGRVRVPPRHATSPACGAAARCPRGGAAACSARSSPAAPRWRPPAASATSRSTPRPRAGRSWSGSASSSSPRPRRSCIHG